AGELLDHARPRRADHRSLRRRRGVPLAAGATLMRPPKAPKVERDYLDRTPKTDALSLDGRPRKTRSASVIRATLLGLMELAAAIAFVAALLYARSHAV